MNKKSLLKALLVSLLFAANNLFAQIIVNPATGAWSNKQLLVLDIPQGAIAFYSLSGNDPESSGFAYDGPVLLDVTGDVLLKVTVIDKNGRKTQSNVIYSVNEASLPSDRVGSEFVKSCLEKGLVEYSTGTEFIIPPSLEYSFGQPPECFERGKDISVSSNYVLTRMIPFTVTDGTGMWRFVLRINPQINGVLSRRDVPFDVIDWNTVSFSNKKYIYKLDNGWWEQPKLPVTLDRSVSHMISWQPVDFSAENSIKFFVLPPKAEVIRTEDVTGSVNLSFQGESGYKFGLIDENGNVSELYESLELDTFQGDAYSGTLKAGIFYDSVYQSQMDINFSINKRVPARPVFVSSESGLYSRKLVTLNIQSVPNTDLYVAVTGPVMVQSGEDFSDVLFSFQKQEFKKTENTKLLLQPSNDGAVAYKVSAYTIDSNHNKSSISEYKCVIDTCNFYLDAAYNSEKNASMADGSKKNPFSSFDELLPYLEEERFVKVYLTGDLTLPARKILLSSNIELNGLKNARLIFQPETSLTVRNASFALSDVMLAYAGKGRILENNLKLINLEHSVFDLSNVEFSGTFGKTGSLISADNSVVSIKDSGLTCTSDTYASVIESVDSKISVSRSRITTISGTCINFSAQGGIFELRSSNCKVCGIMGRVCELFDTQSFITDNVFSGELKKSQGNNQPVYTDSKNYTVEYKGNKSTGF